MSEVTCAACGSAQSSGSAFCAVCGQPFPRTGRPVPEAAAGPVGGVQAVAGRGNQGAPPFATPSRSPSTPRPGLRDLAHDLARRLVEAQAEEGGMAQPAVGRPLHERDLRHELGLDPGRGTRDALLRLEGGRVAHQRRELLGELVQRRAREARPHLAGVDQAIALEVADQQRTIEILKAATTYFAREADPRPR